MVETLAISLAASYALNQAASSPRLRVTPFAPFFGVFAPSWIPGGIDIGANPLVKVTKGQRLGDLQIQETAEGAPDNRCFGPKNRVGVALVWMSDLKEVKQSESGGGKGGSGGVFITYQYFAHLMVRACRARTPISRIPKIWADAKILYDDATDVSISSAGIDTKIASATIYSGGQQATRNYLILESDIALSRPDISTLKSGSTVVVSGYTGSALANLQLTTNPTQGGTTITLKTTSGTLALLTDDVLEFAGFAVSYSVLTGVTVTTSGVSVTLRNTIASNRPVASVAAPVTVTVKRGNLVNNGTFTVVAATKDPDPAGTQISQVRLTDGTNIFRKFAVVAIGPTVALVQTNPASKASQVGEVTILTGGPDQAVPDILQEVEGGAISQVYAMRNRAGFVLRDLKLTDFGNRIPNLEALVEVTADPGLVADAIKTVLVDDAEFPESAIDVSGVTGSFDGFSVRGPTPPNQSLLPLVLAFDLAQWERGGRIFFANRSAIPEVSIPAAEVGSWSGTRSGRGLQIEDESRDNLPSAVHISFRSESKDFQTVTKTSSRTESVPSNVTSLDLGGLVISDNVGQQIADRLMALAWGAQRRLTAPLPQSRAGVVREGMILSFGPIYGQNWKLFVDRCDRGANMLVVASGMEYDPALIVQAATSEGSLGLSASGNTQDGRHTTQQPAELTLLDLPPLRDEDRNDPGIYVAARSGDPSRPWRGGVLYWSRDQGASWNRVADVETEAATGEVVTAPTVSVLPGMWDRVNTIRVRIRHRQVQLGGVSEDSCLAGANRFLIGAEIIGAASVVFISTDPVDGSRTYDLSKLLRGQQDTDDQMDAHVAGDSVVWLDGPGLQFVPLSYSHIDGERLWKLVPHGGAIVDALDVRATPTARNCRPFHVRDVAGTRSGPGHDLTMTWERMSRASRKFLVHGEPLDEESEAYEVDIVVSGVVKRTIAVSARTTLYTGVNQTADGITPGNPVSGNIYQISAGLRRGQATPFTV